MLRSVFVRPTEPILIAAAVLAAALCARASAQDEAGWIPFAEGENRPVFDVVVNGEPTRALIDTALSVNALSTEFATRAGLQPGPRSLSVRDVDGGQEFPVSGTFTMELGGNPVELDRALMMPTGDVGLVLGRPLLKVLVIQIDYPKRRLRLLPPDAGGFEGNVRAKRGHHNQPMVRARIDGNAAWLTLDTSNDTLTVLDAKFAGRKNLDTDSFDAAALDRAGIGLWPDVRTMRVGEFELGPFKIQGVPVASPLGDAPENAPWGAQRIHERTGADGVLGYELLRNFVLTMNMARDEYHLYPP